MLSRRQIGGLKFRRQQSIGPFIVDFYCPELKLAIELDGAVHSTYAGEEKDLQRDFYLNSKGIRIMHFENRYVFDFPKDIIDKILEAKLKIKLNN